MHKACAGRVVVCVSMTTQLCSHEDIATGTASPQAVWSSRGL